MTDEMISFGAERLMELNVKGPVGAGPGERSPDRQLVHALGYLNPNRCRHRRAAATPPGHPPGTAERKP
ncbi:MAG: hypothetical protein KDI55_24760 [Anaerolineae bacterium]|nr:hypothetical protein [Anaerolineae bacterium]